MQLADLFRAQREKYQVTIRRQATSQRLRISRNKALEETQEVWGEERLRALLGKVKTGDTLALVELMQSHGQIYQLESYAREVGRIDFMELLARDEGQSLEHSLLVLNCILLPLNRKEVMDRLEGNMLAALFRRLFSMAEERSEEELRNKGSFLMEIVAERKDMPGLLVTDSFIPQLQQ